VHPAAATATHLTATHSHNIAGLVLAVLAALIITAGYLLLCAIWPLASCSRCHRVGKIPARIGRGYRPCRHCDGTGYRIRPGTRAVSRLRAIHRNGTR
jgi:hypothetical protein